MQSLIEFFITIISRSVLLQCVFVFPIILLSCYIFGFFQVWFSLFICIIFYLISIHKNDRQRFQNSYIWTLRTLLDKRNELPQCNKNSSDKITKGVGGSGETQGVELYASIWWKTNAKQIFQDKILNKIVKSLNENIAPNTRIIDEFIPGNVYISEESPKLLSISCKLSSYNSIYQDMIWEYNSDTYFLFYVIIAGQSIPIEIKDIKFLGTIRLETIFPHSEYIDNTYCKEQEKYTMAISIIDKYLLDFDIVTSGVNLGILPTLKKWIHTTIYEKIQDKILWPNQIRLFGPNDHIYHKSIIDNDNKLKKSNNTLEYAKTIDKSLSTNSNNTYISAITLLYPDGDNISPPEGFELLDKTCTGTYAANLNSGSLQQKKVYLCIQKSDKGLGITDIGSIQVCNFEKLPQGYKLMKMNYFGEDACIYENTNNNIDMNTYLCYEKSPQQTSIIEDIKILFDEEIPRVRELKLLYQNENRNEFPIGYSMLEINSIQLSKRTKKVYLCIKRLGGTSLKSLIKKQKQEESSTSKTIFNTLQSISTIALNEVKDLKQNVSARKQHQLQSIGISFNIIEKAKYLSTNKDIFLHFSLKGQSPKDDFFTMNEIQQKHAVEILKQVPQLGILRMQLAPAYMSDACFWYIYFTFIKTEFTKK